MGVSEAHEGGDGGREAHEGGGLKGGRGVWEDWGRDGGRGPGGEGGGDPDGGRDSTSGMAIINAHSRHAMTTGGNDGMEGG